MELLNKENSELQYVLNIIDTIDDEELRILLSDTVTKYYVEKGDNYETTRN